MEADTLTLRDIEAAPPLSTAEQPAPAVQKTSAIAESIATVHGEVAKFDQINAGLLAIEREHPLNVIVAAIDTPAGMRAAESAWRAYRNPRLEVERARKAAKAPVLALGKAIDSFAGQLEERLRRGEDHYKAQIEAEEARRAAAKAEAERKERERVEAMRAGVAKLRSYVERAAGQPAEAILKGITALSALAFTDEDWQEFVADATAARDETVAKLRELHAKAVEHEAHAAEAERLRVLAEQQAAELAALRAREAERAQKEAVKALDNTGLKSSVIEPDGGWRRQAAHEYPEGPGSQPQPLFPKPAMSVKSHPVHGFSYTPEYRAWQAMRKRCTDPEHARWADYGGRGITVCDRWLNDVSAFIADMGAKPSDEHELDRIDNDAGYSPENCRWVLRFENNRNKSNNRVIEWNGQSKTLAEWCEITGLPFSTIKWRLDSGWPIERAMTEGATPDATDSETPADASPRVGAMGVGQAADAAPAAEAEPVGVLQAMGAPAAQKARNAEASAALAVTEDGPMLKLGDLCAALGGLPLSALFIADKLNVAYAKKERAAIYYTRSQAREIQAALVRLIQEAAL